MSLVDPNTRHVVPVNDLIEHETDVGSNCVCGPETQPVERDDGSIGWVVVHNSLDGREHREPDHDRAACPVCSLEGEEGTMGAYWPVTVGRHRIHHIVLGVLFLVLGAMLVWHDRRDWRVAWRDLRRWP